MDPKAQEILNHIMEEERKQGITDQIGDAEDEVGIIGRFEQAMYKLSDIDPDDFLDAMSNIINAPDDEEDAASGDTKQEDVKEEKEET